METYPKSPKAIERFLMTSITVALLTILIFGASERGVISSYTRKWNETEMNAAIWIMMAFVALCVIRGIYLLIKSRMNGLLYIIGIPLGLLILLELGTVIE
ncbi:hypothetical protein QEH52_18990 [Coraliomargarita sp. SDUM461003]|uniref:Uncharacterized protein n=1 Tax=Thalassobacterium maritimum TaxID=3041265 RepID=A0ABU1AZQ9_9BACT|nr:hypothetical protein [Coraliomargarita sp. SDUM461003]MDQ8209613.1 hypothetical protein [Coraliomargarita sp. SDUM461003]